MDYWQCYRPAFIGYFTYTDASGSKLRGRESYELSGKQNWHPCRHRLHKYYLSEKIGT